MAYWPSVVLRREAQAIESIDSDIVQLVKKMKDIMIDNNGVGLAGPQVGVSLRLFVISVDGTKENATAYINPVIEPSGSKVTCEEGCLSLPGIFTKIKRQEKCTVTATDINGQKFTEEADGLKARALQHEYDHLEGITLAEKMGSAAKIVHRRQLKKLSQQQS